jgi:hypothetical protein
MNGPQTIFRVFLAKLFAKGGQGRIVNLTIMGSSLCSCLRVISVMPNVLQCKRRGIGRVTLSTTQVWHG